MRSYDAFLPILVHVTYFVRIMCGHDGADCEGYADLCRRCLKYLQFHGTHFENY